MGMVHLTLEEYAELERAKQLVDKIVINEYTYTSGVSIGVSISKREVEAYVKNTYKSDRGLPVKHVMWREYENGRVIEWKD